MFTIAVANHKGGVAKTATVHNLGAAISIKHKQRVLLVDADPQASLSGACGIESEPSPDVTIAGRYLRQIFSLAEVLGGSKPGQVDLKEVLVSLNDNLSICPADSALATAEMEMINRLGRENVLKKSLSTVRSDFDICLIDCPPGQGLLTINALTAADAVIIPSQPTSQDLRGLILFLETINQVKAETNPHLKIAGILLTFYDSRLKHHQMEANYLKEKGLGILPVAIGRSVRVAEASTACQPVVTYDPRNNQSLAYQKLADYLVEWIKTV